MSQPPSYRDTLDDCPLCRDRASHPVAPTCQHFFCASCVDHLGTHVSGPGESLTCPICGLMPPTHHVTPTCEQSPKWPQDSVDGKSHQASCKLCDNTESPKSPGREECPLCRAKVEHPPARVCEHNFCQSCINDLGSKMDSPEAASTCPICGLMSPAEQRRAMQLVHELNTLAVGHTQGSDGKPLINGEGGDREGVAGIALLMCEQCHGQVATQLCEQCHVSACPQCRQQHDKWPPLATHTWQALPTPPTPIGNFDMPVYCQKHPDNEAGINCKACKALLCSVCKTAPEHNHHRVETIKQALQRILPKVKANKEKLETLVLEDEERLVHVRQQMKSMLKKYDEMEREVMAAGEGLMAKLRHDIDLDKKQVNINKIKQIKEIDGYIEALNDQLKSDKNTLTLVNLALASTQGAGLLKIIQTDIKPSLQAHVKNRVHAHEPNAAVTVKLRTINSINNLIGHMDS